MISSSVRLLKCCITKDMILPNGKLTLSRYKNIRQLHLTSKTAKEFRSGLQKVRAVVLDKDELIEGERSSQITNTDKSSSLFPDTSTPETLFNGVPYNQLHILNIKATPNNTIMSITDYKGIGLITHSAGCEGFKNAKKGTNIAAQQVALVVADRAFKKGIATVRLRIQGIGPGRMGSIKGIQLSGLNVASITDDTRVSWNPQRPRKQRRI